MFLANLTLAPSIQKLDHLLQHQMNCVKRMFVSVFMAMNLYGGVHDS
jgi:hypothetical protein